MMTGKEIVEARHKLGLDIIELLDDFTHKTGLITKDIRIKLAYDDFGSYYAYPDIRIEWEPYMYQLDLPLYQE